MRTLLEMVGVCVLVLATSGTARGQEPLLSVAQANVVASAQHAQVKRCYFRHALVEPRATGQVRVDVFVRRDGGVAGDGPGPRVADRGAARGNEAMNLRDEPIARASRLTPIMPAARTCGGPISSW